MVLESIQLAKTLQEMQEELEEILEAKKVLLQEHAKSKTFRE